MKKRPSFSYSVFYFIMFYILYEIKHFAVVRQKHNVSVLFSVHVSGSFKRSVFSYSALHYCTQTQNVLHLNTLGKISLEEEGWYLQN